MRSTSDLDSKRILGASSGPANYKKNIFNWRPKKKAEGYRLITNGPRCYRTGRSIPGREFQIVLSRSFVGGVFAFISALEVATAQVFLFPSGRDFKRRNEGKDAPCGCGSLRGPRGGLAKAAGGHIHKSVFFGARSGKPY
jgi:hypothetical protein